MGGAAHGPLPIVVGVTGHRDLREEDLAPLANAVRRVLETITARNPHSDLLILSPLAEGADRLVARVALELGARFVVVMPFGRDDYRRDFSDRASIAEFDGLLARAECSFVVPSAAERSTRPERYAEVGAYVARHCHVLLALWNGHTPHKIGGTAEVVRYRREGMAPEFADVRPLRPGDAGPVYHVVTPRLSEPVTLGTPFDVRMLPPAGCPSAVEAEDAFRRVCRCTDVFNTLAEKSGVRILNQRKESARFLLPSYALSLPPGLEALRAFYACADQAAIEFQKRTRWAVRGLFWLAFAMVVAFELFSEGNDLVPQLPVPAKLLTYLVLLAVAVWLLKWGRSREIDTKHLDYRALVEGLRVQFYWRAAEVRSVAADYCVGYRFDDMEWIRLALRAVEMLTSAVAWSDSAAQSVAALAAVVDDWVKGQRDYFARAARREQRLLRKLEQRTTILFGLSLVAGVVAALLTFHVFPSAPTVLDPAAVTLLGVSTAAAALIHAYAGQRALSLHVTRYDRMQRLFDAGLQAIEKARNAEDWALARQLLTELGREALEENFDWITIHRERPMELPG